jgi:hypothetical protein
MKFDVEVLTTALTRMLHDSNPKDDAIARRFACGGLEVFTAMKIQVAVFWVVTPCGCVVGYQHVGGLRCFYLQGDLKI